LALGRFKKVGEFELEFSGQAKRRGGVDYSSSYRIYSLIPADQVLAAVDRLRALPEVLELQHLDNTEINRRVAKTLNTTAKRVFGGEGWVFKDSRAIWARIVFETHFTRDARWKTVNETVFWREMLGHEDMDTQESYKAFKISYTNEAPAEPVSKYASRLEALEALDEQAAGGVASQRIHSWVKKAVAASPDVLISQKAISVNVGSHRQAIKDYLAMASEALATPNRPSRAVAPEVPAEVANARPRISVTENAGRFVAIAKLNGVEIARGEGGSQKEAYSNLLTAGQAASQH
ncbi:MAG: protelomerase family protein, partial [Specibacter sp.]